MWNLYFLNLFQELESGAMRNATSRLFLVKIFLSKEHLFLSQGCRNTFNVVQAEGITVIFNFSFLYIQRVGTGMSTQLP